MPAIKVEQVVVLGNVGLTTPVLQHLLQAGIDCVFCSLQGHYYGRLFSTESRYGLLRRRQLEAVADAAKRFALARAIVRGKLLNQRTLLLRYQREKQMPELEQALAGVEQALQRGLRASTLEQLLAAEGYAGSQYYRAFRLLLKQDLGFRGRVKRPPTDPVNALLSFGYTLLLSAMQTAVRVVGLDPFLGFLHATEYSKPSLALDLIEEFRAIVVDAVVLRLVNTGAMTAADFAQPEGKPMTRLTQEGLKKFLVHYEGRMQTEIKHPMTSTRASYRRIFELQARQMARVIMGQDAVYKPFVVK